MIGNNPVLGALFDVLAAILNLYYWVIIIAVIVSWLLAFGIINRWNPTARSILNILDALTEPLFRQIRRIIPPLGGLDLSPLIALLLIYFLQNLLARTRFSLGIF